jgi:hypothetical protein
MADPADLRASDEDRKAQLAERRRELQSQLMQEAGGGAVVFSGCSVIWLAAGASGYFWPFWVGLAVVLPLLRSGWRLYGPAPDLERVEQDLAAFRRRRDRDARRDARRRERRRD